MLKLSIALGWKGAILIEVFNLSDVSVRRINNKIDIKRWLLLWRRLPRFLSASERHIEAKLWHIYERC